MVINVRLVHEIPNDLSELGGLVLWDECVAVCYLDQPPLREEFEVVATAPPLPEDVRSRLARLLGTNHCRGDFDRTSRPREANTRCT
jgi:hypothetical protein